MKVLKFIKKLLNIKSPSNLPKQVEEHLIKTNADKFEEVFGFRPNIEICPMFGCEHCANHECLGCSYNNFFKQVYKETEANK